MYWFPIAAITNDYKLSGLKPTQFYYLTVCRSGIGHRSRWVKIKVSQGCVPLWKLQGRISFLAFSSCQRLPALLSLWCFSSICKASNTCGMSSLPHPRLRTHVIILGPPRRFRISSLFSRELISSLNHIHYLTFPLQCNVIYLQVLGIGTQISWRPLFCLPQKDFN